MKKILILVSIFSILFSSCNNEINVSTELDLQLERVLEGESPTGGVDFFRMPDSEDLGNIPQDENNPLSSEKVLLGKMLFHESGIGTNPLKDISTETYSCASCHFAGAGFQAGRFQGLGDGGIGFGINGEGRMKGPLYRDEDIDAQPIRTPSIMNGAYQKNMFWNGQFGATGANLDLESQFTPNTPKETNNLGYEGLEIQAIAGLDLHRQNISEEIITQLGYKEMFDEAFSDFDENERYSKVTAGLAIAAFERTVLANESPFQKWLTGEKSALTDKERRGAILFFDKAECVSCHTGPALNRNEFHALGMKDLDQYGLQTVFRLEDAENTNLGRGGFTGNERDNYKFKVPQLYNLVDSPFLGHGSSFNTIRDVIRYKNTAIQENSEVPINSLSFNFIPLGLTPAEIDELTSFVRNALYDPNLIRYQPDEVNSGGCIPVNDPLAIHQVGCQ